jgi:multidrug efflux pump subunit AcrB
MKFIGSVLYVFKPLIATLTWINGKASAAMDWAVDSFYSPLLKFSLNNISIVMASVISLGLFALGLIFAGIAPFSLFPNMDGREINASISFPDGTREEFTERALDELEASFRRIDQRIIDSTGESVIKNLYRSLGEVGDGQAGPAGLTRGSHVGNIEVELTQPDEREITTKELNALWRKEVPKIAGTDTLKFAARSMGPGGSGIEFKLLFDESSVKFIDKAAQDCKEFLASKVGVSDIEDDSREGKTEMLVRLNEIGRALGLDEAMLASAVRGGYYGEEVRRQQRGRHEIKLMVRYPESARQDMEEFENIRIRDNQGVERPLLDVATPVLSPSAAKINRLNQRRSVTISASVDRKEANAAEIIQQMQNEFLPQLIAKYRDEEKAKISVNWEGEAAQNIESMNSMFKGFAVALMCMYVLLTLQFRSYLQPLIILAIIPFGWLGAIIGHAIMQIDLTLFSFFGLIALTGVVVNDSIVLVDFINREIRRGVSLHEALLNAGRRRFRPIMLTSFTTVAGLFPMLMETSLQAQVLIPMAASLIFGLITGTLLILILVPIFYRKYAWTLEKFGFPLVPDDSELDALGGTLEPQIARPNPNLVANQ